MKLFTKDSFVIGDSDTIKSKRRTYAKRIATFDTETTSYYNADGDERATLYEWQLCIGNVDNTYYGRYYDTMREMFESIHAQNGENWQIIFVHNLGFDFEFIRNCGFEWDVFARTAHKPIFARCEELKIELRDTLTYFHKSLDAVAKDLKLTLQKISGYNYNLIRHHDTPLTDDEIKYGDYDVKVLYLAIEHELSTYRSVATIPYTQTGKVRRVVLTKVLKQQKYDVSDLTPHSRGFLIMQKAFLGGYTHANFRIAGEILHNVDSFDFSSSYPAVMVSEKYPSGKFFPVSEFKSGYLHIVRVRFYDMKSIYDFPYMPFYSAIKLENESCDNGKLYSADMAEYIMTEIDFAICKKAYSYSKIELLEIYASYAKYLPKPYVEYILDLYANKTSLKGIQEREKDYAISKEYINSLYGMMVTNNVRDEIEFKSSWDKHVLTRDEIDEKLTKMRESGRQRLAYQWGLFVTAYARRNLFLAIRETKGNPIAYVDTDSLKSFYNSDEERQKYLSIIDAINEKQRLKIQTALIQQGIDPKRATAVDPKGRKHHIGILEYECQYDSFRTWGAKKYAYVLDGHLSVTVAGLSKTAAIKDPTFKSINDFEIGRKWNEEYSGRTISTYCENMTPETLTDYTGKTASVNDVYGINIARTSYQLGLTDEYMQFIGYETIEDVKMTERLELFDGGEIDEEN